MKITELTLCKVPKKEQRLLAALLNDLEEINSSEVSFFKNKILYINWQTYHNEYSPERVDPCPDYYGYYTLRDSFNDKVIGIEMTIEDLDMVLCTLYGYIVDD